MWPAILVVLALVVVAGCVESPVVYPGDGTVVALDIDGPLYDADPEDVLTDVRNAIAIWAPTGARFQIGGAADYRIPVHVGDVGPCGSDAEGCFNVSSGHIYTVAGTGDGGLATTLAHELGHAIGLKHVSSGIMAPGANRFQTLQPDDLAEYRRVWGRN